MQITNAHTYTSKYNLEVFEEELEKYDMLINVSKTKTMVIANSSRNHLIILKESKRSRCGSTGECLRSLGEQKLQINRC